MDLKALFHSYIDCINRTDWTGLERCLDDEVLLDNRHLSREEYLFHLQKEASGTGGAKWGLDVLLCDDAAGTISARLIRQPDGDQASAYSKHVFCWVADSRIREVKEIYDVDAMNKHEAEVLKAPTWTGSAPSQPLDLKDFYREYIDCINAQTMATDLSRFCHPVVTHNGVRLTLEKYRRLIESSQEAISGLTFNIHTIITDESKQQLAAKLDFTGTPVQEWAGAKPNGKSVEFSEHVFYWLDKGKISEVVSLVDLRTYREELAKE